jgi:ABC-type nitrate/sulfonate/bicarbonate transport system permease component
MRRTSDLQLAVISVVAVLAMWELAVRVGFFNPLYASSPVLIASAAVGLFADPQFLNHIRISLTEFLIGFGAAAILGTTLGLIAGSLRRVGYAVEPILTAMYVTPRTALLPVIVLWFGYGMQTTTIIVFLGAFFVIVIYAMAGAKTVDAQLIKAATSFSASRRQIFRTIVLPSTVPSMITGLRLGVGRALIGIAIAEIYAAAAGVGYFIHIAGATLQIDKMFVAILIISITGLSANLFFSALERRYSGWRPALREEQVMPSGG